MEVEGEKGLKDLITNHFSGLFTPMAGINMQWVLNAVTPKVTQQMNEFLCSEYTIKEVEKALNDMGDLEAPGADGMPAIFYKRLGNGERGCDTRST